MGTMATDSTQPTSKTLEQVSSEIKEASKELPPEAAELAMLQLNQQAQLTRRKISS